MERTIRQVKSSTHPITVYSYIIHIRNSGSTIIQYKISIIMVFPIPLKMKTLV